MYRNETFRVDVAAPDRLSKNQDLLDGVARDVADRLVRTDLARPGFAHLDLGTAWQKQDFRQLLVELGLALGAVYRAAFGRGLRFFALGRFDQQVSTEAHRDGAPE